MGLEAKGHVGHVGGDGSVESIQSRDDGLRLSRRPEGQVRQRVRRHNGSVQHIRLSYRSGRLPFSDESSNSFESTSLALNVVPVEDLAEDHLRMQRCGLQHESVPGFLPT